MLTEVSQSLATQADRLSTTAAVLEHELNTHTASILASEYEMGPHSPGPPPNVEMATNGVPARGGWGGLVGWPGGVAWWGRATEPGNAPETRMGGAGKIR